MRSLSILLIIVSSLSAQAVTSVYESSALLDLLGHLDSSYSDFVFYESQDQLSVDHGLECRELAAEDAMSYLAPMVFSAKGELPEDVVAQAFTDLELLLGGSSVDVCLEPHQFETKTQVIDQIAIETQETQLVFYF